VKARSEGRWRLRLRLNNVPMVERVEEIKGRLATLCSHEAELDVELSELHAAKGRKNTSAVRRVTVKRDAVQQEIRAAESELDVAVNAPVSGGRDPTEWLPDELMLMVLERLPFATLWSGACERVCERWARLMETTSIVHRKREGRWAAYEAGTIKPRELKGHAGAMYALAVGLNGRVYSGLQDTTIMVWSSESGAHLQTLTGHTDHVYALAVGLDGNIYSGSRDQTVRVWSGASGAHVQTLEGHTHGVLALAVGLDGKIYSGSLDCTIRVWAADTGTHLQTLAGHRGEVRALAVGSDGAIYSGSADFTIRVWSGEDGAHLRTLAVDSGAHSLAVGLQGRVYSGMGDGTIWVYSADTGSHLQTLLGHENIVRVLVVGSDGNVFSGSCLGNTVRVWSSENGALLHTLKTSTKYLLALALERNGTLYSGAADHSWGAGVSSLEIW
jgi:WD40 repeat protein